MKYGTHETDLHVLPETQKERNNLQSYMETKKIGYCWQYSNVKGQDWYGKQFMDIPFRSDLKEDLQKYFA